MKIVDAIGNEVTRGRKMYWKGADLFVEVAEVVIPTEDTPGGVILAVKIPVPFDKHKPVASMEPFISVIDPFSEQVLSKIAGGR